jgi:hypothetical protein
MYIYIIIYCTYLDVPSFRPLECHHRQTAPVAKTAPALSAGHWMHQRDAHGGSGRNGLRGDRNMWFVTVKIGKHTKNHGKSRFLMGKSTIIGNMLG